MIDSITWTFGVIDAEHGHLDRKEITSDGCLPDYLDDFGDSSFNDLLEFLCDIGWLLKSPPE